MDIRFRNWGWGNNELEYYTENRLENARQEDGNLIIEARKDDGIYPWSSARLTTRGKESFLYGKSNSGQKYRQEEEPGQQAGYWVMNTRMNCHGHTVARSMFSKMLVMKWTRKREMGKRMLQYIAGHTILSWVTNRLQSLMLII